MLSSFRREIDTSLGCSIGPMSRDDVFKKLAAFRAQRTRSSQEE
jgi:hypothetical protein